MGAGKSSAAKSLAPALGLRSIDLDARVEGHSGRSIGALFRQLGEPAFRSLEREVLQEVLAERGDFVLALGGGTVVDWANRARLLESGLLVTLRASPEELARRVGAGHGRPLLAGSSDLPRRMEELLRQRAGVYAECHLEWDTQSGGELLAAIGDCLRSPPILVALGERSYVVRVGERLLTSFMPPPDARQVLLVTDENVHALWAEAVGRRLSDAGLAVHTVVLPPGEIHKTLRNVETIWDRALDAGLDRDAFVLGVGGGVVTDMAAFAASTLLRGVRVGLAPTSLLAMVDAAVGGKTGFDRPQGKNLVGSFWQPTAVVADVGALSTLPLEERCGGLAEVVKSAWIDSEVALEELERDAETLAGGGAEALERAVRRSVALKARVVADDEREQGRRALLNLGHSVGHALEAAAGFGRLGHGQAVALGMLAACRVERELAGGAPDSEARLRRLFERLGLPTDWERRVDAAALSFLGVDKKRRGGRFRFVMPGSPGAARVEALEPSELLRVLRAQSPG